MIARDTKQKKDIIEEIQHYTGFFNAEELHSRVLKKNKHVGIATVYRSLKVLTENGELHSYLCNRRAIYSTNKHSHCHFTCEVCGKKEHIIVKKLDFLQKEIQGDVCHVQIDCSGVCKKCKAVEGRR